ncbi:MAG TPA: hypothetical protein VFS30_02755 [Dehalococcoidia bacterium]|nr:hypothetical protein [Dehalococcoidia bacterium]
MVQVGSSVDQEHKGLEAQQDQSWTHLINDAVKDFVQAISDSSRQLAAAAERFAGESLSLIDDATSKAESSAAVSGEMAEAAKKAATDAQRAAESLQAAVSEAGDQIRKETRNSIDEALAQAREAQQASERAKAEIQQQAEDLIQRIERSGEGSQQVISAAQQATEEVRAAAERISDTAGTVDAAVTAAQEAAQQARNAAERAESQAGEAAATASNTQQAVQEARGISARIEESAGSVNGAIEAAQKAAETATYAAQHVEERISEATSAVEAGQRAAQEAQQAAERAESTAANFEATVVEVRAVAEQTREVVARIDQTAADATSAASSAQQASQSAVEAAQRVEQGSGPNLGQQADTLLERLENDYQLLTSLVQELASRISSMATVAASQADEGPAYEVPAWESTEAPPAESFESPIAYEATIEIEPEQTYVAEVSPQPVIETVETPAVTEEPAAFDAAWIETTISYPAPTTGEFVSSEAALDAPVRQPEAVAEPEEAKNETPSWHSVEVQGEEQPLDTWIPEAESAAPETEPASPESTAGTPEPVGDVDIAPMVETADRSVAEAEAPSEATESTIPVESEHSASSSPTLFGRVQVNISPVPDFDRLLSLDSALSRVSSVQTVTLADYAQEEVTFRIDLATPLDASDFAQQLGEAAGISTEVAEANASAVTLRLA